MHGAAPSAWPMRALRAEIIGADVSAPRTVSSSPYAWIAGAKSKDLLDAAPDVRIYKVA
jgi:hypothetical protein